MFFRTNPAYPPFCMYYGRNCIFNVVVIMLLCRLIYFSERNPAVGLDIDNVITASRRNNVTQDVTGLLYFDGEYFVQALEGRRSRVTRTYNRIVNDQRHRNLYLVSCGDVRERLFSGWSMAMHGQMSESTREQMTAFFSLTSFDPENVTAESLTYFLQILAVDIRKNDQKRIA